MSFDVTRCGKFHHFGKTLKVFGYLLKVYFALGKILNLIGQIYITLDKFSLMLMGIYWKDNLAIWSHWQWVTHQPISYQSKILFLAPINLFICVSRLALIKSNCRKINVTGCDTFVIIAFTYYMLTTCFLPKVNNLSRRYYTIAK